MMQRTKEQIQGIAGNLVSGLRTVFDKKSGTVDETPDIGNMALVMK